MISGSRTPSRSFPSASTWGTSTGNAGPTFGGCTLRIPFRHSDRSRGDSLVALMRQLTPGILGNAYSLSGTRFDRQSSDSCLAAEGCRCVPRHPCWQSWRARNTGPAAAIPAAAHQIARSLLRRKRNREMLQSGKVIDPHLVRDRRVVLAIGTHVNQSRRPAPIFISGIGEKDLRHNLIRGRAVEQPRSLPRHRILLRFIGERKNIRGEEDRRCGLRVARRLSETVVEAAPARSCYMGQNPVQRDLSFFIRIEALVEKVAQKAPVLRDAFTVDPLRRSNGIGSCFA